MTEHERDLARALVNCSFQIGSADKRFAKDMAARAAMTKPATLSPRQAAYLDKLSWKYRRQLPPRLVPAEKPA